MSETDLMRQILVAVSAIPGAVFWRVNVGVFRSFSGRETVRCGIPGQSDIAGCYRGRHVEIEVKTGTGRLSPEQRRWKMAVERAGGIWVLARTPHDALFALATLDAQSVLPPDTVLKKPADAKSDGVGVALP
jgi:hypothetical protein